MDDYLSEEYLKELERLDEKKRSKKNVNMKQPPQPFIKMNVKEEVKRNEGLNTGISQTSVGFKLLQQMGYKEGQGLGKDLSGIEKPLPLQMKRGREGLGVVTEQTTATTKKVKLELKDEDFNNFRNRNQSVFASKKRTRQLYAAINLYLKLYSSSRDLQSSYNATHIHDDTNIRNNDDTNCDLRQNDPPVNSNDVDDDDDNLVVLNVECKNKDNNNERIEEERTLSTEITTPLELLTSLVLLKQTTEEEEENEASAVLNDSGDVENESDDHLLQRLVNLESLSLQEKEEKLLEIVRSLRMYFYYCFYCGSQFESVEELQSLCPGEDEDLHS